MNRESVSRKIKETQSNNEARATSDVLFAFHRWAEPQTPFQASVFRSSSLDRLCASSLDWLYPNAAWRRLHKRDDDEPRQNAMADFLRRSRGDDNELKCRYRTIVHNMEASRRYAALRSP
jgi:hypothetical protein